MASPEHSSGGSSKDDDDKGSGGGGGGGSSAADDYAKQQKKAEKEAKENYKKQAETLQGQIDAIRKTFSSSFLKALKIRLGNIKLLSTQQDNVLVDAYKERLADLRGAAVDNEKSAADQTFANLSNRGRERGAALAEAVANGAGESDLLKAQLMSLRNWNANQADVIRAQQDTLRTINTSKTDLVQDTKTARINNATQANEERDTLYSNYYNQRYESIVQIGNLLGQQAELYGLAGKKSEQKKASKDSQKAFDYSVKEAEKAYTNPGVSTALMNWKGADDFRGDQNLDNFDNTQTTIQPRKKPQGSTLRSWT